MAKFRKDETKEVPDIQTASLPDIIFMMIFFFMITTTLKTSDLMISNTKPKATEVTQLEKKTLVTFIYIGVPLKEYQQKYGTEPRLQLNDAFAEVENIQNYIVQQREQMQESDRPLMTVSLKADHHCQMGIITDVKQALRRAQALRISYSAQQVDKITY